MAGGNYTLTTGNSGIELQGSNLTINTNVALSDTQTWIVDDGRTLTIGGNVDLNGNALSLTLGNNATFSMGDSNGLNLGLTSLTVGSGSTIAFDLTGSGNDILDLSRASFTDALKVKVNVGSELAAGDYTLVQGWTGSSYTSSIKAAGGRTTSLSLVDGNLVLHVGASPAQANYIVDFTGKDVTASDQTSNDFVAWNVVSGTPDARYVKLTRQPGLSFISAVYGSGEHTGDVYLKLVGGNQPQTAWHRGIFGAWETLVDGDVYVELDAGNITYDAKYNNKDIDQWGSVNGLLQGGNVTGSLTLVIKDGTFSSFVTGGTADGTATSSVGQGVRIQIEGGTFQKGVYGGSHSAKNDTGTTTIDGGTKVLIKGGTFSGPVVACNGDKSDNTTINDGAYLTIKDGTFGSNVVGGNYSSGSVTGGAHVLIEGGAFNGEVVGGNLSGGSITGGVDMNITGGKFNENVYGGNKSGGSIEGGVNIVVDGADMSGEALMGGGEGGSITGDVNMLISSGTFTYVYGGSNAAGSTINGNIKITVEGGEFLANGWSSSGMLSGAGNAGTINGDIELVIKGGDFSAWNTVGNHRGIFAGSAWGGSKINGNTKVTLKDIDSQNAFATYTGNLSGKNNAAATFAEGKTATLELDNYTASQVNANLRDFDAISVANGTNTTLTSLGGASTVTVDATSTLKIGAPSTNMTLTTLTNNGSVTIDGTVNGTTLTMAAGKQISLSQESTYTSGIFRFEGNHTTAGTINAGTGGTLAVNTDYVFSNMKLTLTGDADNKTFYAGVSHVDFVKDHDSKLLMDVSWRGSNNNFDSLYVKQGSLEFTTANGRSQTINVDGTGNVTLDAGTSITLKRDLGNSQKTTNTLVVGALSIVGADEETDALIESTGAGSTLAGAAATAKLGNAAVTVTNDATTAYEWGAWLNNTSVSTTGDLKLTHSGNSLSRLTVAANKTVEMTGDAVISAFSLGDGAKIQTEGGAKVTLNSISDTVYGNNQFVVGNGANTGTFAIAKGQTLKTLNNNSQFDYKGATDSATISGSHGYGISLGNYYQTFDGLEITSAASSVDIYAKVTNSAMSAAGNGVVVKGHSQHDSIYTFTDVTAGGFWVAPDVKELTISGDIDISGKLTNENSVVIIGGEGTTNLGGKLSLWNDATFKITDGRDLGGVNLDTTNGALIIIENGSMTLSENVTVQRTKNSDATGYGNLRLGGSGTTGTVKIANGKTLTSGGDDVSYKALGTNSSISGSGGGEVSVKNKEQAFGNVQIDLTANACGINADMTGSILNIGGTGAYTIDKDNSTGAARSMAALNIKSDEASVTAYKDVTLKEDSTFEGGYVINTKGDSLTIEKSVTLGGSGYIQSAATDPGVVITAKGMGRLAPAPVAAGALEDEDAQAGEAAPATTKVTNAVITDTGIEGEGSGTSSISNAMIALGGGTKEISGLSLDNTVIRLAEDSRLSLDDVVFSANSSVEGGTVSTGTITQQVTEDSIISTSVTGSGDDRVMNVTLANNILGNVGSFSDLTLDLDWSFISSLAYGNLDADTSKLLLTFSGMEAETGLFTGGVTGELVENVRAVAEAPYGPVKVTYGGAANQLVLELSANIPEPTTGALSVLALAAFAARRRRKAIDK